MLGFEKRGIMEDVRNIPQKRGIYMFKDQLWKETKVMSS
jgi:hypothetical protein